MPRFRVHVAVCLAALCALPVRVAAQKDTFRDALIGFHAKLAGEHGDEGPAIVAALDRMASALNAWDPKTTETGAARASGAADRADDPARAYETRKIDVLLTMLDRRFQSVPPDRQLDLFPETALVPDRSAVTPVFAPVLYVDGFTDVLEGRYAQAITSFRAAVARDPLVVGGPGEAHRIQGIAAADAGNNARAIEELETAVRLAPDDERGRVALGRALAFNGQTARAEQVLRETIAKLPASADAHSALADLYDDTGRGRDALHEVEAAAALTVPAGKGALYFRLADLHHRFLEYDRVLDPLTRRLRLDPNNGRAHADLGLAYIRVGRTDDALVELIAATLIGPEDAEALTAMGQIQFDAGNYRPAEVLLQRAIVRAPQFPQARYVLGQTLARLGREAESRQQLAEFDRLRAAANDQQRRQFEQEQKLPAAPR